MNDGTLVLRFVMQFLCARICLPAHSRKFLSTPNRMPSRVISSSHFAASAPPVRKLLAILGQGLDLELRHLGMRASILGERNARFARGSKPRGLRHAHAREEDESRTGKERLGGAKPFGIETHSVTPVNNPSSGSGGAVPKTPMPDAAWAAL